MCKAKKLDRQKFNLLLLQEQQAQYNQLTRQYLIDCKKLRQLDYKIRQETTREEN